jgi:hypothetical protein
LKTLISEASGNTLAYGLMAFAKILQVPDVRAEAFGLVDNWLIDRVFPSVSKAKIAYRLGCCTSTCEHSKTCYVNFGYTGITPRPFESTRTATYFGTGSRE